MAVLSILLGGAVLDGVDLVEAYGVDDAVVTAPTPKGRLIVEYTSVSRPALASPFRIKVVQPSGFDSPITLAVSRSYLEVWDENGLYPTPSAETGDEDWIVWEFDPPDGDTFEFFYDTRVEPGRQHSADGAVELRDADGTVLAGVTFRTRIRP